MMSSLDYVIIKDLELGLRVGCIEEERNTPQKIIVNAKFGIPRGLAARTYELSDSVCYATASNILLEMAAANSWKLLETFLEEACQQIFETFPSCLTVFLQAQKFVIPQTKWVGVELERSRMIAQDEQAL